MKKIVFIILTVLTALSVAACSSSEPQTPADSPSDKKLTVYFIPMDKTDPHWTAIETGLKKAADEAGNVELITKAPEKKDADLQVVEIEAAVLAKADAIIIAAVDPAEVSSALKAASEQRVKVIYVDSPAMFGGSATFATDNAAAGKQAGLELISALTAAEIAEGTVGLLSPNDFTESVLDREEGFRSAFNGTKFKIADPEFYDDSSDKAKTLADKMIDKNYVAIFATNQNGTAGLGSALKGVFSKKPIGAGFDKSDEITAMVNNGTLLFTVTQNPEKMGELGMNAAKQAVKNPSAEIASADTGVTILRHQ